MDLVNGSKQDESRAVVEAADEDCHDEHDGAARPDESQPGEVGYLFLHSLGLHPAACLTGSLGSEMAFVRMNALLTPDV